MAEIGSLILWILGLGVLVAGAAITVYRYVHRDSWEYDREFVWGGRYTEDEVEVNQNK